VMEFTGACNTKIHSVKGLLRICESHRDVAATSQPRALSPVLADRRSIPLDDAPPTGPLAVLTLNIYNFTRRTAI